MRHGRKWWCHGCKRWHPLSRWIEGSTASGDWCAHSIKLGVRARRNDLPYMSEQTRAEYLGQRPAR